MNLHGIGREKKAQVNGSPGLRTLNPNGSPVFAPSVRHHPTTTHTLTSTNAFLCSPVFGGSVRPAQCSFAPPLYRGEQRTTTTEPQHTDNVMSQPANRNPVRWAPMTLVIVVALCLALTSAWLWTAVRDGAQRNQAQERQDGEQ